jgi:hypothetical protein
VPPFSEDGSKEQQIIFADKKIQKHISEKEAI